MCSLARRLYILACNILENRPFYNFSCYDKDASPTPFETCSLRGNDGSTLATLAKCQEEQDTAFQLVGARSVELLTAQRKSTLLEEELNALHLSFERASSGRSPRLEGGISSLGGQTLLPWPGCDKESNSHPVPSPLPKHITIKTLSELAESSNPANPAECKLNPEHTPQRRKSHSITALEPPISSHLPLVQEPRLPLPSSVDGIGPEKSSFSIGTSQEGCEDSEVTAPSKKETLKLASCSDLENIFDLRKLVDEAIAGKTASFMRLRQFYKKVLSTPRDRRTLVEEYILLEWGKSIKLDSSLNSLAPMCRSPSIDCREIFVDASAWGIGFVSNGKWLAWQLKPGWQEEGRSNNWLEMVAVEMGIHVAVSVGFKNCNLALRSDNAGAVHSLTTRKSRFPAHREVIQRIETLTHSNGIEFEILWVSTDNNPADEPSRGRFPPKQLLFPVSVPVPLYLTPYIYPPVELRSLP